MLQKTNQTTIDLLKAADIIRERGHTKYVVEDKKGRVCLLGAINLATLGISNSTTTYILQDNIIKSRNALNQVDRYIREKYNAPNGAIYWNNEPERTEEEVIEALEQAAFFLE